MLEMTITVNIPGLERLAEAIFALAGVKGTTNDTAPQQAPASVTQPQPVAYTTPPVTPSTALPTQQPVYQATPNPTTPPVGQGPLPVSSPQTNVAALGAPAGYTPPATVVQGALPTTATAPQYTQDQLAVAATGLVDAGKSGELVAILQQFGANSLMELQPGQYGAFATKLREAGARI